jgi:hypothetical protein
VVSFIYEIEGAPFRPPINLMAKVKTALKDSAFRIITGKRPRGVNGENSPPFCVA